MVPRHSTSICLCDTRSLSYNSHENENNRMLKSWMTKGVRHGELVFRFVLKIYITSPICSYANIYIKFYKSPIRNTDNRILKKSLKCKAHKKGFFYSKIRKVNFVIYVVNGLSVLKAMENTGALETQYSETIISTFNSPFLSFTGICKTRFYFFPFII